MTTGNPELGKERRLAEAGQLTLDDLKRQQFAEAARADTPRVLGDLSLKMLDLEPEIRGTLVAEEPDQAA
jgi:hypothetical protein